MRAANERPFQMEGRFRLRRQFSAAKTSHFSSGAAAAADVVIVRFALPQMQIAQTVRAPPPPAQLEAAIGKKREYQVCAR